MDSSVRVDLIVNKVIKYVRPLVKEVEDRTFLGKCFIVGGISTGLLFCWFGYKTFAYSINRYYYKSPPQLFGLPVIGSLLTMLIYKENFAMKILPKYGDLVKYNIVNINYYKINDVQLSKKLFDVAKDRPQAGKIAFKVANLETPFGVLPQKESLYRRKIMVNHFSKLLDTSTIDANICKILQEITYEYLDKILARSKNSKSNSNSNSNEILWYPRDCVRNATFNVIYLAMFNKMLKIDDELFQEFNTNANDFVNNIAIAMMSYFMPNVLSDLVFGKQKQTFISSAHKVYNIAENDYDEAKNKRNDEFITLAQCYADDDKISRGAVIADLGGLLSAGIDTTSHTIEVGIILLGKYPNVQKIVYDELVRVFGTRSNDQQVQFNLSKMNLLHQFKAFVYESMRISCALPDGLMRTCEKDIRCVKLKNGDIICDIVGSNSWGKYESKINDVEYDYIVKKYSWIEINGAYLMKNDKRLWNLDDNPMVLNLDYWLKNDGKFHNNQNILPFGAGARQCPGQTLAIKEIFAFFGNLLLRYELIAQNNDPNSIDIKYTFGEITATVKPAIPVQIKKRVHA